MCLEDDCRGLRAAVSASRRGHRPTLTGEVPRCRSIRVRNWIVTEYRAFSVRRGQQITGWSRRCSTLPASSSHSACRTPPSTTLCILCMLWKRFIGSAKILYILLRKDMKLILLPVIACTEAPPYGLEWCYSAAYMQRYTSDQWEFRFLAWLIYRFFAYTSFSTSRQSRRTQWLRTSKEKMARLYLVQLRKPEPYRWNEHFIKPRTDKSGDLCRSCEGTCRHYNTVIIAMESHVRGSWKSVFTMPYNSVDKNSKEKKKRTHIWKHITRSSVERFALVSLRWQQSNFLVLRAP